MSAALRVRLRGAPGVSGGLRGLGCGTTVGRNRLANRGRAALDEPESPGILSYHQSVRAENLGVLQSILPPEMLAAGRMPKKCRRNPRIFNSLEIAACCSLLQGGKLVQVGTAGVCKRIRSSILRAFFNSRLVSSCGATGFFFSDLQAIAFQVAVQTGAPDSQDFRGSQPRSLTHLEHALDVHFAHLFERQRFPVVTLPRTLLPVLQLFRQVRQIDEVSRCRSEEHTSELQSRLHLVCRLLLATKKTMTYV